MSGGLTVAQLLRWRLAAAEAEAPPPPPAAALLAAVTPWWERWPERFRLRAERLRQVPLAVGFATVDRGQAVAGHPVAVLLADPSDRDPGADATMQARVLYLVVRDGRLRLRLQLDVGGAAPPAFDATFVLDAPGGRPPFAGEARLARSGEYRVEAELPADLASAWASLRVTDRMPFHLILRAAPGAG